MISVPVLLVFILALKYKYILHPYTVFLLSAREPGSETSQPDRTVSINNLCYTLLCVLTMLC